MVNPDVAANAAESLRGKNVYIYNFLDVRKEEYNESILAKFDQKLDAALDAGNAGHATLHFRQSPLSYGFAKTIGGAMIPVVPVIRENLAAENAFATDYRLVIFPSNFESIGAWRNYEIRWTLINAHSGRVVFDIRYTGRHMVMFKEKENGDSRAEKLVKFFVEQTEAMHLF